MKKISKALSLILAIIIAVSVLAACGGKETAEVETGPVQTDTAPVADGVTEDASGAEEVDAIYLGVKDYGAAETNKENRDNFTYRFEIDGEEVLFKIMNGTQDEEGNYDYPIQNLLKEGYSYHVTTEDGVVIAASEILEAAKIDYTPRVSGTPGETTLKNFLMTALGPVGTTLYIYGGGWDWQDEGSAIQTRTLGVSADWVKFFNGQDENYTYKEADGNENVADPATSYYPYGEYNEYYYAGLDCTGYFGWTLYNTFENESGKDGYVGGSTKFAKRLSENGWGEWTQDVIIPDGENGYAMKPGDVMSIKGHVWISLGTCADGSVLIVHSTPSRSRTGQPGGGVQISAVGYNEECEAYALAEKIMSEQYPEWFERYPIYLTDPEVYFAIENENAGRFTWNTDASSGGLTDPEHIQDMTPEEVMNELFGGMST